MTGFYRRVWRLSAATMLAGQLTAVAAPALAAPESDANATPESAPCAICSVREKAGPEPVAASIVYQDKTYYFCSEACKEEFQRDPKRWIKAAATPADGHQHPPARRGSAAAVPT